MLKVAARTSEDASRGGVEIDEAVAASRGGGGGGRRVGVASWKRARREGRGR